MIKVLANAVVAIILLYILKLHNVICQLFWLKIFLIKNLKMNTWMMDILGPLHTEKYLSLKNKESVKLRILLHWENKI